MEFLDSVSEVNIIKSNDKDFKYIMVVLIIFIYNSLVILPDFSDVPIIWFMKLLVILINFSF